MQHQKRAGKGERLNIGERGKAELVYSMKVKGERGGGGERGVGGQDVGLESGGGWGIWQNNNGG